MKVLTKNNQTKNTLKKWSYEHKKEHQIYQTGNVHGWIREW